MSADIMASHIFIRLSVAEAAPPGACRSKRLLKVSTRPAGLIALYRPTGPKINSRPVDKRANGLTRRLVECDMTMRRKLRRQSAMTTCTYIVKYKMIKLAAQYRHAERITCKIRNILNYGRCLHCGNVMT